MKNIRLLLIGLILLAQHSFSQNYSFISASEAKTYFTNPYHKLNGLRIDSIKNINGNTVYYPFKTIRMSDFLSPIGIPVIDTGASWLGSEIVETPTHDTYIQTKWNDTFFIKNDALLGDSWVVYNDTTDIYFVGTVTAIDTMTIGNMLDSVKTISINAMQGGNFLASDSLNGIQFSISKNNGLVKTFPFYFFPFYNHQDNAFDFTYDNYVYYYSGSYGGYGNIKNMFSFDKTDYQPFSIEQIYNFDVGEVLMNEFRTSIDAYFYNTEIDTVLTKNVTSTEIDYTVSSFIQYVTTDDVNGISYSYASGTKPLTYSFAPLYNPFTDTSKMPEEIGTNVEYYDQNDTSFCSSSARYEYGGVGSEGNYDLWGFKNGFGCVHHNYFNFGSLTATDNYLSGTIKDGYLCGGNNLVGIKNVIKSSELKIFPNPATDFIKIEIENTPPSNLQVLLVNMLGTQVGQWSMKTNSLIVPTQGLPSGIYFLKVSNGENTFVRKITLSK